MSIKENIRNWIKQGEQLLAELEEKPETHTGKTKIVEKEVIKEVPVEKRVEVIVEKFPEALKGKIKFLIMRKKALLEVWEEGAASLEKRMLKHESPTIMEEVLEDYKTIIRYLKKDIEDLEELFI